MKKLIYLSFLAIFSLTACDSVAQKEGNKSTNTQTDYLVLNSTEIKADLDKVKTPQLIDVRTDGEFIAGTILSALNYDFLDGTFQKKMATLDKSQSVFVFCAVGGRSGKASSLLIKNGFSKVIDLKGGYNAWPK